MRELVQAHAEDSASSMHLDVLLAEDLYIRVTS